MNEPDACPDVPPQCPDCTNLMDENQVLAIRMSRLETALRLITKRREKCIVRGSGYPETINWAQVGQDAVKLATDALCAINDPVEIDEEQPASDKRGRCSRCEASIYPDKTKCEKCTRQESECQMPIPGMEERIQAQKIRVEKEMAAIRGVSADCEDDGDPCAESNDGTCKFCHQAKHGGQWCEERLLWMREHLIQRWAKKRDDKSSTSPPSSPPTLGT